MGESPNTQLNDRRRSPRHACTGGVEILQNGRLWGWGKVNDISRCGCYIESTHSLPMGSRAQLRLTIADISLDVGANVVSTTPQVGMGMDFVVESPEQRNKLRQMVENISATERSLAAPQTGADREEARPHMRAALQHLQQAQGALYRAMQDEEGQCAEASQLIENAIHGVMKLTESEEQHPGTIAPASILIRFGPSSKVQ